jgi:hypothetical protein
VFRCQTLGPFYLQYNTIVVSSTTQRLGYQDDGGPLSLLPLLREGGATRWHVQWNSRPSLQQGVGFISPELDFLVQYLKHHEKDIGYRTIGRIRTVLPLDALMAPSVMSRKKRCSKKKIDLSKSTE